MSLSNKLEPLVDEYLKENDKRSIQHIAVDIPGHNGQFFITDTAKIDLTKLHSDFSLAIYFSFNSETKTGKKLKEQIARQTELAVFKRRRDGRNQTCYYLPTNNDKSAIAKMVKLTIQTLFPDLDLSTVSFDIKRVRWHTLKD